MTECTCSKFDEVVQRHLINCLTLFMLQSCTEMVMPMCSNGVQDMFMNNTWNFTAYKEDCLKAFGVTPDPHRVEALYGGKNIGQHSNIIFRCSHPPTSYYIAGSPLIISD